MRIWPYGFSHRHDTVFAPAYWHPRRARALAADDDADYLFAADIDAQMYYAKLLPPRTPLGGRCH